MCLLLGRSTSLIPSFTQLPIVPCLGLRLCGLFSFQVDAFTGVILVCLIFGWSQLWNFMGIAPDVARTHNVTAKFPVH